MKGILVLAHIFRVARDSSWLPAGSAHRLARWFFLAMTVSASIALATPSAGASPVVARSAGGLQCHAQTVPVTLSASTPTTYAAATWLCWKGLLAGKTVQLLVHGFTYDHAYWDFPYEEPAYSYVAAAADAGYATLNLDRLGVGQSDHPSALLTTVAADAYVLHQMVQGLRTGAFQATPFARVALVGHSLGSLVALTEASTYADVDGVVASGWLHFVGPSGPAALAAAAYPAFLDPKFAGSGLPLGYLTTIPGTRGGVFYQAGDADPHVIAADEATKQTGTSGELATYAPYEDPLLTLNIHVPVLEAVGQDDAFECGVGFSCANGQALVSREALFFSPQACLEGYVLPDAGHDMNLHLNAAQWYAASADWMARRVGVSATGGPTQPC